MRKTQADGMIIAQVSDLHLSCAAPDSFERLAAILDDIEHSGVSPDLLVITGDLADDGSSDAYRALSRHMQALPMPWLACLGNHDRRDHFASVFPDRIGPSGFIQQSMRCGDGLVIALDTLEEGSADGVLCSERLDWLEGTLHADLGAQVVIAMHHPPVPFFLPKLDDIGLRNAEAFWHIVETCPNVRTIICGHIHRPATVFRNSTPVVCCRGNGQWFPTSAEGDPKSAETKSIGWNCLRVLSQTVCATHECL
jgi:3',5'-cyclic AMP phosphodiesterase CpdA